jgi:hypothetical protein
LPKLASIEDRDVAFYTIRFLPLWLGALKKQ